MLPGSRVDLGRLGLGVVIRAGAAAPDVSTPDALKQTLLNAQSIAHTDPKLGGTSVIHLMKIADGFGIGDEVRKKSVNATGGNDAVAKVAKGEAEIAVVLVSEIHDKGAKLAATAARAVAALDCLRCRDPLEQHRPQERARVCRRADQPRAAPRAGSKPAGNRCPNSC